MSKISEKNIREHVRSLISQLREADETMQTPKVDAPKEYTLEEIADELGFTITAAKKIVDKAADKFTWLFKRVASNQFDELILNAWHDYIEYLESSNELPPTGDEQIDGERISDEDIQLLIQNPEMGLELDNFRDYLKSYFKKSGYQYEKDGEKGSPDEELEMTVPEPGSVSSKKDPKVREPGAPKVRADVTDSPEMTRSVYRGPGGVKYTKVKGKMFTAAPDTKFKPGQKAVGKVQNGILTMKDPATDHTQDWASFDETGLQAEVDPTKIAQPRAERQQTPSVPRADKATYNVYRDKDKTNYTKIKGQTFKPTGPSQFKPGSKVNVNLNGDNLKVSDPDSDHTQDWKKF